MNSMRKHMNMNWQEASLSSSVPFFEIGSYRASLFLLWHYLAYKCFDQSLECSIQFLKSCSRLVCRLGHIKLAIFILCHLRVKQADVLTFYKPYRSIL